MKNSELPLPKLLKKAQDVFNAYIRKRDADLGCISCGGEVENAGHYFSVGQYSALRFNEMNVNGQSVHCNMYRHGNLIHYRQGLVRKYGEEKVKWLEDYANKNRLKKWSRFELDLIIKEYKEKIKHL